MTGLPSLATLERLLGAVLSVEEESQAQRRPRGISIDSRRSAAGDLFFALPGSQTDGHRFAAAALSAGAAAAVVRRDFAAQASEICGPLLVVDDPLRALQRLAAWHRTENLGRIVAVTGSNGKTIVKDALTALMAGCCDVACNPGSFNSQVGVPLALLGTPPGAELGIFEAGISAPGDMHWLRDMLRPDFGILTNVGLAHIAAFGERAATAREKASLFSDLPRSGWLLLPAGDPVVEQATGSLRCRRLHYDHAGETPHLEGSVVSGSSTELRLRFPSGQLRSVLAPTRSRHLVDDLLAAIAAAILLGLPEEEVAAALRDFSFGSTRMEIWRSPDGVTIINDACSSDPISVQAALRAAQGHAPATGRRIFVFGGMKELGRRQEREHRLIGDLAAEQGFSHLVIGPGAGPESTARAFKVQRPAGQVLRVGSLDELPKVVRPLARAGDTILVKGPRHQGLASAARSIWESMAPTRMIVNLGAIGENIASFRSMVGPQVRLLAMLKAWAYGTEFSRVATWLQQNGADWIGVSAGDEGALARRAGVRLPILVTLLGVDETDKALRYRLTPVVYSMAMADALIAGVRRLGGSLDVHLEVDTGMGRVGVKPQEVEPLARRVLGSGVLRPTGLMTHLSCADDPDADDYTQAQLNRFQGCIAAARRAGMRDFIVHAAATAGLARFADARFDMVRTGLGLYGIHPSPAVAEHIRLQLAVSLVSRIVHCAAFQAGDRIGYAGSFVVREDGMRVGVVGLGYNDGMPWRLSNRGHVLLQGRPAPIVGRISMDSMVIDLSGHPQADVGDEVLVFGQHEGHSLRPEAVAELAGTIPYELLVKVDNRRVQRLFVDE